MCYFCEHKAHQQPSLYEYKTLWQHNTAINYYACNNSRHLAENN